MIDEPRVVRTRHEARRRKLVVTRVQSMPAGMLRVVLGGAELAGFTSLGFDDHVKVFFPDGASAVVGRDFTPRHFDPARNELWIDFFLHDAGPAAAWAAQACAGQSLEVAGPRGSAVLDPEGIDAMVLIGDETALPAIGRRLEELPARMNVQVILETERESAAPLLESAARLEVIQVVRSANSEPGATIIDVLRRTGLPQGRCFVWVAHEYHAARAIRTHLRNERGVDGRWIKAAAYWQRGQTGKHETLSDG